MLDIAYDYKLEPKQLGSLYRMFCPFHDDTSKPNFTIWPRTNSWFCFACNTGGDKYKFVSKIENISIEEARGRIDGHNIDMEELSDYIEDIGVEEKPIVVNDELNILLSKLFREFLYQNPKKAVKIVELMREVDKLLLVPVSPEKVHEIVESTRQNLKKVVQYSEG